MNTLRLLRTILFLLLCCTLTMLCAKEPIQGLYRWSPDYLDNFGDAISQPIVERILGRAVYRCPEHYPNKLVALGSILHSTNNGDIVWGTGNLFGWFPPHITELDVRAVRGPMTRDLLLKRGIPCPPIYGDPALLMSILFPEFQPNPIREYIVIPHFGETELFRGDPNFVNSMDPWEIIMQKIMEAKLVIASSLHGIIVAESYGIPARMLLKTNHPQFAKYQDYYQGTGRPNFKYATSVEEALRMGGESPPICDLQALLNAFPYDLWEDM